ncbi:ATP-dependent 6-phosphofructokinase 7 [Orobanche hederae]
MSSLSYGGYRGFLFKDTIPLTPKVVNDIHKRGGTILGTSRGGHDTMKIVDSIEDRGINQVYIIGGDGTQKGAAVIYEEIRKRGLKVAVAGIPKTIDNDISKRSPSSVVKRELFVRVIDKSFGFDTAVEEAQWAINAAHVEAESTENLYLDFEAYYRESKQGGHNRPDVGKTPLFNSSTGRGPKEIEEAKKGKGPPTQLLNDARDYTEDDGNSGV